MSPSRPRRGIERRILNSILLVAIVPLMLALVVGYITAREGQGNAVKQALLVATQKTSHGLRIASITRLSALERLSSNERLVAALTPDASGRPSLLKDPEGLIAYFSPFYSASGMDPLAFAPVFSVYDPDGNLLATTNEDLHSIEEDPEEPSRWRSTISEPEFVEVRFLRKLQAYGAQAVAPVYASRDGAPELLGFVSEVFDASMLMRFAMGWGPGETSQTIASHQYQIVYASEGHLRTLYFTPAKADSYPKPFQHLADSTLAEHLTRPDAPESDALRIKNYQFANDSQDVFVAYSRPFENLKIYVVVFHSANDALFNVYVAAVTAVLFSILLIAVLCLNAYRNVHNNIVRPVSLLNEGAQIIGQGDLELKLKIGTGDEIEELASSFNKMALALKKNIGQLEESEEKYRGLVTSMRDGIFQTDPQWDVGFLNPAGVEIFRHEVMEQALGDNLQDAFYNPDDFARIRDELLERGFVERVRTWMKRRDGKAIIVELSANAIVGEGGELIGYEGIIRDLSKSVRLEREARDRAERLSAINQIANVINSSLEAGRLYESLVVEIKRLIDCDNASLALLDKQDRMFEVRQLWPERDGKIAETCRVDEERSCPAWVARNRESLIVEDFSEENCTFDTDQFPAGTESCLCVPLYAAGRIIGSLNLGATRRQAFSRHDVQVLEQVSPHVAVAIRNAQLLENLQASLEEVTLAREKLHAVNEELKTLDEMKTNLLSNVSHELRTPLVSVMGYTDMIYNGKAGPITAPQKEYLGISLRNIEKLVTLIENLLDFSRLHRGTETLLFDTFDLVDCARSGLQLVKPVADGRDLELVLDSTEEQVLVEGDKGKLGQVFNNLLSNAVKFNHPGGSVTVGIHSVDDQVEVTVTDTGIGIPPEAQDKVFTRFYQYDSSSTRKYGGTGIGLSIAQDIARLHGSRITVSSEEGAGTTFRFSLPLRHARREEGQPEPSPDAPLPAETRLLVELLTQDRALSTQVLNLLTSEGINVIHAGTLPSAAALAHKHRPDCVLVDMECAEDPHVFLDNLLSDTQVGSLPFIMLTNDEALFERYRTVVAARVKRSFRKSSLLSGIQHALNQKEGKPPTPGSKILCVDDDKDILGFMASCLGEAGFSADTCTSGEEALTMVAQRKYGLVLLDIAMPGIDGWETCRQIKSDASLSGTKVYLATAKPIDSNVIRQQDCGCDGYILKPFRTEDLIELVRGARMVDQESEEA
jgi:PAS domain S-box-containing protein